MPHLPVFPAFPGRDAMGRICVADGLGRVYAGRPEYHVEAIKTSIPADFLFGLVRKSAVALEKKMVGGMLAFCVLNEQSVMYVARGSLEEAVAAHPNYETEPDGDFPKFVETDSGLSVEQLTEVNARLCSCYRQYGVGSLTTDASGFKYQVLVPNAQEYALHQAAYDAEQAAKLARRQIVSVPVVSLPVVRSYPLDLPTQPSKRAKFDAEVDAMVRRITGERPKKPERAADGEM
jgi:hypothetical protein